MPISHQKFLAIRLSSIGDIVHALPAVSALAETYPQAEITWAVESRYALLLEGNPGVRRLLRFDTLGWRKRMQSSGTLREVADAIHSLREDRFDAVIDFQGLLKTAILSRLCRSPRRIGYAKGSHREPGAGLFYTEEVPLPETGHAIEECLALVARLGARANAWQFPLPQIPEDKKYIDSRLAEMGVEKFILIIPGGGWMAKRWPPRDYAALTKMLAADSGADIVLSGSPAEEGDIRVILRGANCERTHYVPTTLGQYLALARRTSLFIGGDTGPMHLAAAVGAPIVAIMGPTSAMRNGPFSSEDIVLSNGEPVNHTRRGRSQKYLEGISARDVLAAVKTRLARSHGR